MNTSTINKGDIKKSISKNLLLSNHYLTEQEVEQIKNKLKEEEKILKIETLQILQSIKDDHSEKGDLIDRANKECELEIESKIAERDTNSLNLIRLALNRIQNDENFGYCNCCDEPIGFKRLMARPVTKECIDCKSLKELDQMTAKLRFSI